MLGEESEDGWEVALSVPSTQELLCLHNPESEGLLNTRALLSHPGPGPAFLLPLVRAAS